MHEKAKNTSHCSNGGHSNKGAYRGIQEAYGGKWCPRQRWGRAFQIARPGHQRFLHEIKTLRMILMSEGVRLWDCWASRSEEWQRDECGGQHPWSSLVLSRRSLFYIEGKSLSSWLGEWHALIGSLWWHEEKTLREVQQVAASPMESDGGLSLGGGTKAWRQMDRLKLRGGVCRLKHWCIVWCEGEGGVKRWYPNVWLENSAWWLCINSGPLLRPLF